MVCVAVTVGKHASLFCSLPASHTLRDLLSFLTKKPVLRKLPRRYDKVKIVLKEIIQCQFCACMNPTAGSFNITPRMQRQFMTLAVQMPPPEIVRSVYFQVCALVGMPRQMLA